MVVSPNSLDVVGIVVPELEVQGFLVNVTPLDDPPVNHPAVDQGIDYGVVDQ